MIVMSDIEVELLKFARIRARARAINDWEDYKHNDNPYTIGSSLWFTYNEEFDNRRVKSMFKGERK